MPSGLIFSREMLSPRFLRLQLLQRFVDTQAGALRRWEFPSGLQVISNDRLRWHHRPHFVGHPTHVHLALADKTFVGILSKVHDFWPTRLSSEGRGDIAFLNREVKFPVFITKCIEVSASVKIRISFRLPGPRPVGRSIWL